MPRGQKPGWKDTQKVPKTLPTKPVRVATGIWLRPSGRFFAYVYLRKRDVFIGSFATLPEASEARAAKGEELKKGRPLVARSATAVTLPTFVETTYFPQTLALLKASTARATRSRYQQHIAPAFAEVALRDIDYARCTAFRTAMMAKDLSGQTRREAVRLLRSILADAAKRGLLPANPAAGVNLPSKGGEPVHVPSYAEAVALVAAITHPVARMAASLLLKTGLRLNEALSLEWKNIDLDARTIFVAHSIDQVTGTLVSPKTPTAVRLIDIPWDLAEELRRYRAGQKAGTITRNDPWVFPSKTERKTGKPCVLNDRNFGQRCWEPALRVTTRLRLAEAITDPMARMAAILLAWTDMPTSNGLALEWDAVDTQARRMVDWEAAGREGRGTAGPTAVGSVPWREIPAALARELAGYRAKQESGEIPKHDPFVFPTPLEGRRGQFVPLSEERFVEGWWGPLLEAATLERFTPHAMRHLYASVCLQQGVPVAYVAQQLGHGSPAFTYKQYARFIPSAGATGQDYVARVFGGPPPTES